MQTLPATGLLQMLATPHRLWSHISLDFITRLPACNGKNIFLLIIDRFSKATNFVALNKFSTTSEITKNPG